MSPNCALTAALHYIITATAKKAVSQLHKELPAATRQQGQYSPTNITVSCNLQLLSLLICVPTPESLRYFFSLIFFILNDVKQSSNTKSQCIYRSVLKLSSCTLLHRSHWVSTASKESLKQSRGISTCNTAAMTLEQDVHTSALKLDRSNNPHSSSHLH